MARKTSSDKKQSLPKNIALFFLSLGLLAGASIMFSTMNGQFDIHMVPFLHNGDEIASRGGEKPAVQNTPHTQKSSMTPFEYTFYDILYRHGKNEPIAQGRFSIQIAAFKTSDRALSYADTIKKKRNITCRIDKKGQWSYVRWGSFNSRDAAERYIKNLSKKLKVECMVVNM